MTTIFQLVKLKATKGVSNIKFNLKKYKKDGKFVALAWPADDYWQTKKGQSYLKSFYELEEAEKKGLITSEEKRFLQDGLTNPIELTTEKADWKDYKDVPFDKLPEELKQEAAEDWASHNH